MENLELAKLVLKQADTYPETFDMNVFCEIGPCGTVACIAGHALLLSGMYSVVTEHDEHTYLLEPDGELLAADEGIRKAQCLLGMSDAERFAGNSYNDIFYDFQDGLSRFRELTESSSAQDVP